MSSPSDLVLTTYEHDLPEVYQIEVTSACNFKCPFCIRGQPGYDATHIDLDLFALICERDLGASYFTELQFTGEPLIHPQFDELADMLGSVKGLHTGLSTNGSFLVRRMESLLRNIDFLTISVDSLDEHRYAEELRIGGTLPDLKAQVRTFVAEWRARRLAGSARMSKIDTQVIDFFDRESELPDLQAWMTEEGWADPDADSDQIVNARSVPDCFASYTAPELAPKSTSLCLNPWMSVSVHADGDVVPCCFAFGKEVVYGNLKEKSLEEIWQTSEQRKQLQNKHLTAALGDSDALPEMCQKCYMRSPVNLHFRMLQRFL